MYALCFYGNCSEFHITFMLKYMGLFIYLASYVSVNADSKKYDIVALCSWHVCTIKINMFQMIDTKLVSQYPEYKAGIICKVIS